MSRDVVITVDLGPLQDLRANLQERAHALLDKVAFDIEASAKGNAPVDTGALRSSIYVSGTSGGGSNYSAARADAASRNEDVQFHPEEKPETPFVRIIGVSVIYALIVEVTNRAYLRPAVERHRAAFLNAWKGLVK